MTQMTLYVGSVVRNEDRILLVRQAAGHPLEGQWSVPWGRVTEGESAVTAALRETWEEGGIKAEVEGLLGVQELPSPQGGGVALVYLCRHLEGEPQPRDTETDAARYFSRRDLDLIAEPLEPWSAWLVRRVLVGDVTVTRPAPASPLQAHGAFV